MFNTGTPSLADIAAVTGNRNDGAFGDNGAWWIIVFVLFFAFGGFGNGRWGNNSTGTDFVDSAIQRGFDNQTVVSKLDGISNGICSLGYDQLAQMNNINQNIFNGFHGVDNAICNLGYQTQQGFNATNVALMQGQNALQSQLANCCCETREAIQGVNYNLATQTNALQNTMCNNTRDIIESQNAGTRAVLDYLCAKENADLRDKVQKLELAASQSAQNAYIAANQEAQTAELIRRINPMPIPAYSVPAPYPYTGYGCNGNCNC